MKKNYIWRYWLKDRVKSSLVEVADVPGIEPAAKAAVEHARKYDTGPLLIDKLEFIGELLK